MKTNKPFGMAEERGSPMRGNARYRYFPGIALAVWLLLTAFAASLYAAPKVADFEQPFFGLKRQGTSASPKVVPLIVIGWQPKGKGEPALDASALQQLFFGATNSVSSWFTENSQSRFVLESHPIYPVLGSYQSTYDWYFYWRNSPGYVRTELCGDANTYCKAWEDNPYKVPPPVGDPHRYVKDGTVYYLDDEGFIGGHTHSWAEAIRRADQVINFSVYDDNSDGFLSVDECLIIVVKAQTSTFGTRRTVIGSDVPPTDLVVDGKVVRDVCELYAAPPHGSADLAVAIEEVLHLAANLADQYPDGVDRMSDDPGRPTQLALTDAGHRPVHIDAYHKLKWGWLNLQVTDHSGTYTLGDVATTGDALVLYSPYLGTDEFFIMENRWRGTSYDSHRDSIYQEGLALWHCIQDPALGSNWARRAVHLRRADPRLDSYGNIQVAETLFDGNDPDRGYTLSDVTGPQNLLFRPGLPSQIRVSNISGAGSTMTVDVNTAPEPGGVYATISEVDSARVHAKGSGYGPPGQWLDEDGIIGLATQPQLGFGIDLNDSAGHAMLALSLAAYETGERVRVDFIAETAVGHRVVRIAHDRAISPADVDKDGIPDDTESATGTDPRDADTDDDGIPDGVEDANHDGTVDPGETDPRNPDSDGDGVQDGTEAGYTLADVGADTDMSVFIPDADASTTTDPLDDDTDNDGLTDGEEDTNFNGKVDLGESDPNLKNGISLPFIPLLLFDE